MGHVLILGAASEEDRPAPKGGFAMAATAGTTERRDALVERLFMDAIGAFDLLSVYLGDVLGLYRALADEGPLTSAELADTDRKSTRLNSSHVAISYAVFCLKKKKKKKKEIQTKNKR